MGKAERTRQYIIEQAAPIFNEKGIAGTTINDIMQATKMAKGGLYGHFESKEEMSEAVVGHLLGTMASKIQAVVNQEVSARQKLFAFIDFYKDPLTPCCQGGCPLINFGVEADDTNPALKKKVGDSMIASEKFIADIIEHGIANGEFSPDFDADTFAVKMFALIEGGTLVSRTVGNASRMQGIIKALKTEIDIYKTA